MQKTMQSREILLSDKEKFPRNSDISYKNFTNIYMWRNVMNHRLVTIDGVDCLTAHYGSYPTFCYLPDLSDDDALISVLEELRGEPDTPLLLRLLGKPEAERIAQLYPGAQITAQDNLSDYIYSAEELIQLPGNRFHQKRNHVNNFEKKYSWEYRSVTPDTVGLLRDAAERLYAVDSRLPDEYAAILDILDHFEALDLKAGILYVDSIPVAYSIGEKMCADTALIHIEKGDRSYDGAYAMINKLFSAEFSDCTYINREEDMGIQGLRKAKRSYHPVRMGEYFVAKI